VSFPLYIAKRYPFSKSSTSAINIITLISVVSIIAGTTVLFVVLSAFSGLRDFNVMITSVIDPDLKVFPTSGKTITFTTAQEAALKDVEGIANFSRVIEERVLLEFKGKTQLANLKGVDTKFTAVNPIRPTILQGLWPSPDEPAVAIGIGINQNLSLGVNDYRDLLKVMVPKPGTGQIIDPTKAFKSSQAVVSGIFQAAETIDYDYVFSNLDFAGALLSYDTDTISNIEIKLTESADVNLVKAAIQEIIDQPTTIKNRIELNDTLYKMLNTENLALYFICTLVLIIALFSFIGSMIMIILDKRKNIKTLSDIGTSLKDIRRIFFYQGALMIIIGGIAGLLLGILLVWLQTQFKLVMLTSDLAYPISFNFWNVIVVLVTIWTLGIISSKIASVKINKALLIQD